MINQERARVRERICCYLGPKLSYPPDLTQESFTVKWAELQRREIGIVSPDGVEYKTVYCIAEVFDKGQSRSPTLEERLEVLKQMKDSRYFVLPCSNMPCLKIVHKSTWMK